MAKRPSRARGRAGGAGQAAATRRPWWVWAAPFAVMLGVLLARNAFLFSVPEYEQADMGANSILIEQARRFTLLVGNYSRERFNHPGPAFLYVESWAESVFWGLLRAVPTAWNGQLIGVYALSAFFAACVIAVAYGWTRSARGILAACAAVGCLGAAHPSVFSSDWMPYLYVPPFLAFAVSMASVTAGRSGDAWIAALSGWFLIHGHAAFLFVVPAMVLGCAAGRTWMCGRPRSWGRPRTWLPVVVISAVFALPMLLELALHGDANYARYFAYGSSGKAGGHTAAQVTGYVLWYWWPRANAWLAAAVPTILAGLLSWRLQAGPVRRFCWSLLLVAGLAVVLVTVYTVAGVDEISQHYIAYFGWVPPVVVLLVIAVAGTELIASAGARRTAVRRPAGRAAALAVAGLAAAAACSAFAAAPATRTSTVYVDPGIGGAGYATDPALPSAVAAMARLAAGRTIVLTFPHDGWSDVTGILVQAERTGVRACVASPAWTFMMTSQFICAPAEIRDGYAMTVDPDSEIPRGVHPVVRLERAIVTNAAPGT